MKRILLTVCLLFFVSGMAQARNLGTLGTPRQVQPTEATKVEVKWEVDNDQKLVVIKHRWRAQRKVIYVDGSEPRGGWVSHTLVNARIDKEPTVRNRDCVGVDDPTTATACCAGAHPNVGNTCDELIPFANADCNAAGDPHPCCLALDDGDCKGWGQTMAFDCGTSDCDNQKINEVQRTKIIDMWKKRFCSDCTITW